MLTTGIFTTHRYEIATRVNEPVSLYPFGDVHRSSPLHAREEWEEFLERGRRDPTAHFLGMGDYFDLLSTSERDIINNPKVHESTKKTFEEMAQNYIARFYKEVSFMKGRIIGLVEGNHYVLFPNGTTSTQRLCDMLGCRYLGVTSLMRVFFTEKTKRTGSTHIDVFAHHGKGAARLIGGSLNRVQQMAESVEADLHLMGHDHKKSAGTSSRMYLSDRDMKVRFRKQMFVRTGSFLKGYEDGESSYVADSSMSPVDLGSVCVDMTLKRKSAKNDCHQYIDLRANV